MTVQGRSHWKAGGHVYPPSPNPTPTSIFEPNKVQQPFQFKTSGILPFTGVQKLYGPKISRLLPSMLQYGVWTICGGFSFFPNYTGDIDQFTWVIQKRSDS